MQLKRLLLIPVIALLPFLFVACNGSNATEEPRTNGAAGDTTTAGVQCDPDNGSITLPEGFCAAVVADDLGTARHLAVDADGDIYVKLRGGGIAALRDTTGDHRADIIEEFGGRAGTGMAIRDGYLYGSSNNSVFRWQLPADDQLVPESERQTVVSGFPEQGQHAAKAFTFDQAGSLYVDIGAPSNACQEQTRTQGSPGMEPCPQLETQAGIWRFPADELNQTYSPGARYATGLRHVVAMDWNAADDALYVVMHGRDQLHQLWPEHYTEQESAELPGEEVLRLTEGANAGWPYCYWDWQQNQKVLAPEYGGDGQEVGRCDQYLDPLLSYPGHWAPNDMLFYTADQFPAHYQSGAFIAFHGSWNRAPLPQKGYRVSFIPFEGGSPSGDFETFADGFAGVQPIPSPGAAEFRPMGLAVGPQGALYISDSKQGRIWRVVYRGNSDGSGNGDGS